VKRRIVVWHKEESSNVMRKRKQHDIKRKTTWRRGKQQRDMKRKIVRRKGKQHDTKMKATWQRGEQ
jgi:hypothetical protein